MQIRPSLHTVNNNDGFDSSGSKVFCLIMKAACQGPIRGLEATASMTDRCKR